MAEQLTVRGKSGQTDGALWEQAWPREISTCGRPADTNNAMLKLEDVQPGLPVLGLEPSVVTTVAFVSRIGEGSLQVVYRTPDGVLKERLLGRADEPSISFASAERPWSFDGDGAAFQLAYEAKRIDLAFLFDPMMAVHASNFKSLPHRRAHSRRVIVRQKPKGSTVETPIDAKIAPVCGEDRGNVLPFGQCQ
jgi:hypothetical protein